MAKTREIKRRIKAVANIKRITKTMQMIATARFQAAQKRAIASQPYARKISELVGELASVAQSTPSANGQRLDHPLLRAPEPATGRQLLLVLTSNRGLCGGYNGNLLRTALTFIREQAVSQKQLDIEVVGKKGLAFFKFNHVAVGEYHGQFTDRPAYDQVERLADRYMEQFASGKYDAIRVVYMSFLSIARQTPRVLQLLPLSNPAGQEQAAQRPVNYDFSPDPKELLSELLPITVKTQLFQCFNEAIVSEQLARMVAMKAATDSAGKMGKELNRRYNRARQAAITTELSEIIAGAASLE